MTQPVKPTTTSASSRPPIVAVLGHIDHGKTSLLDKIRETHVQARETKGITQHIGASEISLRTQNSELRTITFIDTPGHAAFSKMRSRGAQVADLAILVVAADEGFRPQTRESWEHLRAAKLPCIVALNKIDLPTANPEGAKESLFENGLPLEEGGGDIPVVPVSAKTGEGLKELLDMLLLVADMANLTGDPDSPLEAVVIESNMDKNRGPVATVVVRAGRLVPGDEIQAGLTTGKIKALVGPQGNALSEVLPGRAAEILGFKAVPAVGEPLTRGTTPTVAPVSPTTPAAPAGADPATARRLRLLLKADVSGTLEAIRQSLPTDAEVVAASVGDLSEGDILLAQAMQAVVLGFRVKIPASVKKLAVIEKVSAENFLTIYDLLDQVETLVKKIAEPELTEEILGRAEVIAEFPSGKVKIAGAVVREGRIAKKDRLRLERAGEVIGQVKVKTLKTGKEDINVAPAGSQFGVVLDPQLDFEVGDMLVSARSLS